MAQKTRNPAVGAGLREHDQRETDHREDIPVPPAVQARWLGEASGYFEEAYRAAVKGVLRLSEAGLEPTEAVAGAVEDLGDIAVGITAHADELGADR